MNRLRKLTIMLLFFGLIVLQTGCGQKKEEIMVSDTTFSKDKDFPRGVKIDINEQNVLVDGKLVSANFSEAVYIGDTVSFTKDNDIKDDRDTIARKMKEHLVITICEPGTYILSGKLSKGQICVDLGEGAKDISSQKVTLVLNNLDINCDIASAIIFKNVYECEKRSDKHISENVDMSNVGAKILVWDGTDNYISNTDASNREGAIESRMSMLIKGGPKGDGTMRVESLGEGIESLFHLTIDGGIIAIHAAEDSINASKDNCSVITIESGNILCDSGQGIEGDGVDSNGWIVVNGGTLMAFANSNPSECGLDSKCGTIIHGGTIIATGHKIDGDISSSEQYYGIIRLKEDVLSGESLNLVDEKDQTIMEVTAVNDYSILIYSSPLLQKGKISAYKDGTLVVEGYSVKYDDM